MSEQEIINERSIEVRTYFVRSRNALIARGDFSRIYVDYYLHLADYGLRVENDAAEYAKSALVAITLHCASRPLNERVAWTVNFQSPLLNVFAAGDNPGGAVVANVFTENIKVADHGLFYSDTIRGSDAPRRSVVDFNEGDFFAAAERYYTHSDQRPARFFHYGDDEFVLVGAQPDCDMDWLLALDEQAIREIDQHEELSLLEQRHYRFHCGCNQDRMMNVLENVFRSDPDGLFGDEPVIRMTCPRCGAKHVITREALEAHTGPVKA